MAEHSPVDSPASDFELPDLSSDKAFLGSNFLIGKSFQMDPGTHESILGEDPERLMRFARKFGDMRTKPNQAESEEVFWGGRIDNIMETTEDDPSQKDAGLHQSYMEFGPQFAPFAEDNIKPSFYELTRRTESGLFELDMKKLERRACSLSLDETTEDDPSQKEMNVQSLREEVLKSTEMLDKDKNSVKETEPEKGSSTEEQKKEKFTAFKYERKNKLWDRKPHLREMGREFLLRKCCEVNFTEEDLETYSKGLINHVELDLNRAVNILRRIAYPKLCEKHFSSEFPSGAFAKEDEPVENISVDHFEFLHKELPINFLELFKSEDFHSVVFDLEKDPQINNIVPSFIKFLTSGNGFQFPENCFTLILAVLKNPYRKIEVFYDYELPVVNEQMAIAEYLMNCLQISKILDDKDAYEKLAEAIIRFANVHPSFLAHILEGFNALLSNQIDGKLAYQIYCKVLNLMTSIGATIIDVCLPQHFEKISCLTANDQNCDLYFHLLRACEISIANTIEHESRVKAESFDNVDLGLFSDDVDLGLFYTACYNYFGRDLTTRLIPIFKKYEKRKDREEQYLSKKHAIFPTKDGYMNTEMRFLANRNKNKAESESSNFPRVNECTFNSAGKVLFSSSNAQLGYVIQEDMYELSVEDFEYWTNINEFPLSYLEDVTDRLTKNDSAL